LETLVSLENLLKIGQLKIHPVQAEEIERLLAAQRNFIEDVLAWRRTHRPDLLPKKK
jgi:hypothetical protein